MEIFYAYNIADGLCHLDAEESAHCVRVLRRRAGDAVSVIDGEGTYYDCTLVDDSVKAAVARIDSVQRCWGAHAYNLTMAVCPTKNLDRYEWFAEKATEMGIDTIVPVIGEHSERKVLKTERIRKILLSATKQSLKGAIPVIREPLSVSDFIREYASKDALKLIACCYEEEGRPRLPITSVLSGASGRGCAPGSAALPDAPGRECAPGSAALPDAPGREIVVLIGPEGDFSRAELQAAFAAGFLPVHLGDSRLRTETAALTAVCAVYLASL